MAELKRCPFCGGEVSIAKTSDDFGEGLLWWYVTRGHGKNSCECRVFMESEQFHYRAPIEEKLKAKDELIVAWNRRANDGT